MELTKNNNEKNKPTEQLEDYKNRKVGIKNLQGDKYIITFKLKKNRF